MSFYAMAGVSALMMVASVAIMVNSYRFMRRERMVESIGAVMFVAGIFLLTFGALSGQ